MDKGFTRTGRRSKYGAVRNSLEDGKQSAPEMVNGGSEKSKSTDSGNDDWVENDKSVPIKTEVDDELTDKSDKGHSADDSKMSNSTTESEFHGFDRPSTPSAFTIVNELVGRYKADVGDDDDEKDNVNDEKDNEENDDEKEDVDLEDDSTALGSPGQKKMRVQDVYTDSEDDSPKPVKETREARITPKKRPLAQLEAFEEKPASPPPAKRARKKSAKAREAAGDSLDNMRLLSDVSSEVTSSVDVSSKSKAHKDDSVSVEVTSSASTPVSVKKETPGTGRARPSRPTPDMSNPLFIKPLHSGWRRELVYRQTETSGGRRSGDIYYYTPIGKKVRSKIELAQYLKGSEFTLDNFTFTKEPLDVDDPSKQIIREASVRKAFAVAGGADSHTPKKEKPPKLPKTPRASKISSPAEAPVSSEDGIATSGPPSATTSPSAGSTPAAPKGSGTPRVALKTPKQNSKPGPKVKVTPVRKSNADSPTSKASGKGSRIKKESSDEGELEIGMLPPNWDPSASHMGDRSTTNTTVTWKSKSSVLTTATTSARVPPEPCSIGCVGAQGVLGVIPTLQCRVCLCLYHPECVGLGPSSETIHSYVCKNCHMSPKEKAAARGAGNHVPISTQSLAAFKNHSGLPKTGPWPSGPRVPRMPGPRVTPSPSLVGGLTTWLPSSSTVQVQSLPRPPAPPVPTPSQTDPPAPPQTVATIGGQKFIVVPKHNVLSVSPAVGGIPPPLASPAGPPHTSQPAAPPGVYLVPYSAAGSDSASQYNCANGGTSVPPGYMLNAVSDLESKRGKGADNGDGSADSVTTGTGTVQIHHTMANFMSELSVGYAALFHVMEYLKVQELLRASRVCRLWRDLSLHPKLWHTVRMKNSQVCDWDGFAAALRARGTRVLDLRKMLTSAKPDDIERMWKEFCSVIEQADNLQRIDLSRCPASVVEQLARSCPQLRVINAIAIRSEEINLESLNNVPLLEELRLKGTNGMKIVGTLESLMSTRLRHLSLLSVRNIQECNVNSLGDLHNLESLELGDCEGISDDFGPEHLVKLTKLKRLRLEKGPVPACPVNAILEGVSKLPLLEQLEIINFDVKPGFDKALAMCKQVQRLLIIPTYMTTSASTNHIVLCCLPLLADSLSHLVWGLTQELTRVTDLFIDQCEARKGSEGAPKLNAFPGECIPIIKPVLVEDKDKQKKTEENGEDIKEEKKDEESVEKDADKEEKMEVDEEKSDAGDKEDKSNKSHKEKDEASSPDVDDVEALARGFRAVSCMNEEEQNKLTQPGTPPVSILPIPKLQKLLVQLLPNTRVKILKVPFPSTWRQTFPELSHF